MPGADAGSKHTGGGNWSLGGGVSAGGCTDHTSLPFPRVWAGYVSAEVGVPGRRAGVTLTCLPQAAHCTHLELLAADAAG